MLTGDDFRKGTKFDDGCFPCSWHIDLHHPHPEFSKGLAGQEFIAKATDGSGFKYKGPYWAPYRALYSRNIPNLFMAGRNISVDREGLGPVRVMRTTGMMGEVVGKAAWIAATQGTTPRRGLSEPPAAAQGNDGEAGKFPAAVSMRWKQDHPRRPSGSPHSSLGAAIRFILCGRLAFLVLAEYKPPEYPMWAATITMVMMTAMSNGVDMVSNIWAEAGVTAREKLRNREKPRKN